MSERLLTIRVYVGSEHRNLVPSTGTLAEAAASEFSASFHTFNQIPEALAKASIRCEVTCEIPESGYNLGESEMRFGALGSEQVVRLTSTGLWLMVEAPNVESAREAWNTHMEGVGQWRRANWTPRGVALPGEYGEQDVPR